MEVSETLLDDVLRRYGETQEPVKDLAREAGVNQNALVSLAKARGIPTREERRVAQRQASAASRGGPGQWV